MIKSPETILNSFRLAPKGRAQRTGRVTTGVYMGLHRPACLFRGTLSHGICWKELETGHAISWMGPQRDASLAGHKAFVGRVPAILLTICLIALHGCATNPSATPTADPLESFNRDVDDFNMALDRAFIEPVSEGYVRITPDPIRASVTNFFGNIGYLGVIVNGLLQGKIRQSGMDTGRFLVNTTLGFGGIFDIASRMNLPRHEEDLGQTLCTWGVPQGAYLVLPFLGPTTVRDLPSIPAGIFTSLLTLGQLFVANITPAAVVSLGALDVVNTRANLSSAIRIRNQALDPYIFTREAYLQRRLYLCYDGNPPLEDLDDLDELPP